MRVLYRERALADLDDISRYLSERSPTGARNVLKAIQAAIDLVANHPETGRRTSDPSLRVQIVGRHRYQIFYSIEPSGIEILHVRHGSRRRWLSEQSP